MCCSITHDLSLNKIFNLNLNKSSRIIKKRKKNLTIFHGALISLRLLFLRPFFSLNALGITRIWNRLLSDSIATSDGQIIKFFFTQFDSIFRLTLILN